MSNAVHVDLRVGTLEVSLARLLTEDHHIIEFPTLLLPEDVHTGSIVRLTCERDRGKESDDNQTFERVQDEILKEFVAKKPKQPVLRIRNVTQTTVVLEWDTIDVASADLRSLALYKTGEKLGVIPNPLKRTATKLSNLEIDHEYTFKLVLATSAGVYESNDVEVTTQKMTDLSGITVCVGSLENSDFTLDEIKDMVNRLGAKPVQDVVKLDTTHFICTKDEGKQCQRAKDMNIPVVRPEWLGACETERRLVGVRAYYISADPQAIARQKPSHIELQNHSTQAPDSNQQERSKPNEIPADLEQSTATEPANNQAAAEQPAAEQPTSQGNSIEDSDVAQKGYEQPSSEQPTSEYPDAKSPSGQEPSAEQPLSKQSSDEPTAQPASEASLSGQISTDSPATEQLPAESHTSEPKSTEPPTETTTDTTTTEHPTDQPTDQPTEQPTEQPATEPPTEQSATDEASDEKPAAEEPFTETPSTDVSRAIKNELEQGPQFTEDDKPAENPEDNGHLLEPDSTETLERPTSDSVVGSLPIEVPSMESGIESDHLQDSQYIETPRASNFEDEQYDAGKNFDSPRVEDILPVSPVAPQQPTFTEEPKATSPEEFGGPIQNVDTTEPNLPVQSTGLNEPLVPANDSLESVKLSDNKQGEKPATASTNSQTKNKKKKNNRKK